MMGVHLPAELPADIFKPPLTNVPDYVARLNVFSNGRRMYRGQSDSSWSLLPKAGRSKFFRPLRRRAGENPNRNPDLVDFARWRRNAVAFNKKLPKSDLECLAYAQHYGLATRLLDWTENPLVALFFAVEGDGAKDGVVYCYYPHCQVLSDDYDLSEELYSIAVYRPRPFDRRIQAQYGVFTYHGNPGDTFTVSEKLRLEPVAGRETEFSSDEFKWIEPLRDLTAFTIPAESKRTVLRQLEILGFTRKALFPDLEGLSNYINWQTREDVLDLDDLVTQERANLQLIADKTAPEAK